jgi:cytochrome c-type biogenesis protein
MEMITEIGILTAFLAGIISFASPCVLPIIPGYLSFITGMSLNELTENKNRSSVIQKAFVNSIVFVLGFSLIFILLGASATTIGQLLKESMGIFSKIAGVLLIIFGLHMVGVIQIPWLLYEKRIHKEIKSVGIIRSFTAGLLFAFGWTPCIGPILAGILTLAATSGTVNQGIILLSIYSFGLGIPFVLSAIFLNGFFATFSKFKQHLHKVEVTGGLILLLIGSLVLTDKLGVVASKLSFLNPEKILVDESSTLGNQNNALQQKNETNYVYASPSEINPPQSEENDKNVKADYGKFDFEITTLSGKKISLSDYSGKVVLVNIWAPWCGPCRGETPGFVKIYNKYKDKGFEIIGVAVQTNKEDVQDFIYEHKITYNTGISNEVAERYGTFGIPDNYLFTPDGKVFQHFVGFTDEKKLESAIQQILNNKNKNLQGF